VRRALAFFALTLLAGPVLLALPRADFDEGTTVASLNYYAVRYGGKDYAGLDLLLARGFRRDMGIGANYTLIRGHGERATLGGFFLSYRVLRPEETEAAASIYGGFKYRTASKGEEWSSASGFEVGALADLLLSKRSSAHIRMAGVFYEDRRWLEVEFGLGTEVGKNLHFDLGYKSYRHSEGTLGGFIFGLTYRRYGGEPW